MTQETRNSETVRAIWNKARTLQICLGADFYGGCGALCLECGEDLAYRGPILSFLPTEEDTSERPTCIDCAREADMVFADTYVMALGRAIVSASDYYAVGMDELAAHFPLSEGIIERGPRPVDGAASNAVVGLVFFDGSGKAKRYRVASYDDLESGHVLIGLRPPH